MQTAFTDALAQARDELAVELVTTPEQLIEAQRLRHKVYCEERGFEPGSGGLERDEYDPAGRHVLVRSRLTGTPLGTVRVVMSPGAKHHLPMEQACAPWVLAPLPVSGTGEVSRFALTRDRTGVSPAAAALMRLSLVRGVIGISGEAGLSHWCAIMEPSLLRLLRATGIHFVPVGPSVEYHGIRQPAVGAIGTVLARMRREQPLVWSYVTADGTLHSEAATARRRVN
jgi:N-acyl-L-homoserine lactone synthetase